MKTEEIHCVLKSLASKRLDEKATLSTLQDIRKHAMSTKTGVQCLVKQGCIPCLLNLLCHHLSFERDSTRGKKHASEDGVSMAVSIISNLLMDREAQQQVKREGIETLGTILTEYSNKEVQVRCCRALGNLAMDATARAYIAQVRLAPSLVKLLEVQYVDAEEEDPGASCAASTGKAQTPAGIIKSNKSSEEAVQDTLETIFPSLPLVQAACRTVRYLIDEAKVRQQLLESGVVWALAVLVKSENSDMVSCVMRVLCELWVKLNKKVSERMSSEVVKAGVMKKIMEMVNNEDDTLSHQAFTVLLPLTHHPHAAALIGASDGVPFFLNLLESPRWQDARKEVISGLCLLAKEAVNRIKIREGGGLKVFLKTLRDDDLDGVHDRVMSSLVSFLYDDASLDNMLENGLVDILLTHLQHCGGYSSETPVNFYEDAKELLESTASDILPTGNQSPSAYYGLGISVSESESESEESDLESIPYSLSPKGRPQADGVSPIALQSVLSGSGSQSEQMVTAVECKDIIHTSNHLAPTEICSSAGFEGENEDAMCVPADCDDGNAENGDVGSDTETGTEPHKGHVYSMNSPTYQAETTWHMHDYHPGITCKSFHPTNPYMSPNPGFSNSDESGSSVSSPYSPLSADSYYSPPYSNRFSPAYSSISSSPAYSCATLSPNRSLCESQPATPVYSGPLSQGGVSADILSPLSQLEHGSPPWSNKNGPVYAITATEHDLVFSSSEEDSCDLDDREYCKGSADSEVLHKSQKVSPLVVEIKSVSPNEKDLAVHTNSEFWASNTISEVSCVDSQHQYKGSSQGFETDTTVSPSQEVSRGPLKDSPVSDQGPDSTKPLKQNLHKERSSGLAAASQLNLNKGPGKGIQTQKPSSSRTVPKPQGDHKTDGTKIIKSGPPLADEWDGSSVAKAEKSMLGNSPNLSKAEGSLDSEHFNTSHTANSSNSTFKEVVDQEVGNGSEIKHSRVKRFLSPHNKSDSDTDKLPSAKRRKTFQPGQYAAVTQNNILILLSRLSVRDDLSKQLASSKVMYCLLDHLALAEEPQDRCVRILSRIVSSPHCLDSLLAMCVPAVIVRCLMLDPGSGIKLQAIHSKHRKRTSVDVTDDGYIMRQLRIHRNQSVKEETGSVSAPFKSTKSLSMDAKVQQFSTKHAEVKKATSVHSFTKSEAHQHHYTAEGRHFQQSSSASSEKQEQDQDNSHGDQDKHTLDLCQTGVRLLGDISHQAMCPYGEGVVSHVLHRHTAPRQLVFATSLLYLLPYWSRERRQKMLFCKGTLDKLLSVLCTPLSTSQATKEAVVTGLAFLLHHLQPPFRFEPQDMDILLQKAVTTVTSDSQTQPSASDCNNNQCMYAVTKKDLHLRAGKSRHRLGANRDILMRKSQMFSAMLQGSYIESTQSEVTITDSTTEALKFILHFLHGCDDRCSVMMHFAKQQSQKLGKVDTAGESTGQNKGTVSRSGQAVLKQCLDTIILADRFLLPELAQYLCSVVSCILLSKASAAEVFRFAAFHGLKDLAEDSMQVLLLSPQPLADTASQMIELAQSEAGSEVTASITALVKRGVANAD